MTTTGLIKYIIQIDYKFAYAVSSIFIFSVDGFIGSRNIISHLSINLCKY